MDEVLQSPQLPSDRVAVDGPLLSPTGCGGEARGCRGVAQGGGGQGSRGGGGRYKE